MTDITHALNVVPLRAAGPGAASCAAAGVSLAAAPSDLSLRLSQPGLSAAALGRLGEDYACGFLVRHGWRIVDRNWRCRFGELDVVAFDRDGVLVFVEVKTRRGTRHGRPEEAVTPRKLVALRRAMGLWLDEHGPVRAAVRIDVVSLLVAPDGLGHGPDLFYIPGVR